VTTAAGAPAPLHPVRLSHDGKDFVTGSADAPERFVAWGVNYDHDGDGRLLDDYWEDEWEAVVGDFREIRDLGANVIRVHLQLGKFMVAPDRPSDASLARLADLVALAESTGLYLDVTGLGCYHRADVPAWYDELPEAERWDVQARFWAAVAGVCRGSAAVFCYDLMNEPVIGGGGEESPGWLAGEFGGKHFVQRIAIDLGGRSREEIAGQWVAKLASAIRLLDPDHLITVGVIPWAYTFKGAKPLFYAPGVGEPLDFVSVHFYPESGKVEEALEALRVYDIGRPLVVEEIFPLKCTPDEVLDFAERSRPVCDGWVSFYWGKTVGEYEAAPDSGLPGALTAAWLRRFGEAAPRFRRPAPAGG
jgi:hypothetical protein